VSGGGPGASGAPERSSNPSGVGPPQGDPLWARLFPPLPGVVKWGLERTERLLAGVGDPHRAYPVLHVGGTNGKGSVARIWSGILRAAGLRTGLYTSPHLISFRERIQVDGASLPDSLLEQWAMELRPLILEASPSSFEASTAFAFLALARAEVDVAVVEVGLGGRLDSTNVVSPVVSAITNVAVEHREMLGETVEEIAREKAGIMKPGTPTFTAEDDPRVLEIFAREAERLGVPLVRVPAPGGTVGLDGSRFELETGSWGRLELASPLLGRHQLRNVALAVRALEALPPRLPVSAGAVVEGILGTRVPGRLQVEREGERIWLLDVAHNPAGMASLTAALGELELPSPRVGLVGILGDKAWDEMVPELARGVDLLVLTVPESAPPDRRWDPQRAGELVPRGRVRVIPSFPAAMEAAREASGARGTVVVAGSLSTVGDALRHLDRIPPDALPPPFDFG
jgi:dihydrofolate synthase / folylpolyglutamate synthase